MSQALELTLLFIINIAFDIAAMFILIRLLLQWLKANPKNVFYQKLIHATNPVIMPLRQFLPTIHQIDMAALVVFLLILFLKLSITLLIKGVAFHAGGFIFLLLAEIINQILNLYFFAILLVAIISWLSPQFYNPMVELLYLITSPILMRARQYIPPIAGLDLTPLFVLIAIKLINILVVGFLYSLAT